MCLYGCFFVCVRLSVPFWRLYFLSYLKKRIFHLIEQALRSVLVKTEFKYMLWLLRKSKITALDTVNSRWSIVILRFPGFILNYIFQYFFNFYVRSLERYQSQRDLGYLKWFLRNVRKQEICIKKLITG